MADQSPSSPGAESPSTRISRLQEAIGQLEADVHEFSEEAVKAADDPVFRARAVANIRETVRQHVPVDATIAVASRGTRGRSPTGAGHSNSPTPPTAPTVPVQVAPPK